MTIFEKIKSSDIKTVSEIISPICPLGDCKYDEDYEENGQLYTCADCWEAYLNSEWKEK